MAYTSQQIEYIDSVDGDAHNSAVEIIGRLETENANLKRLCGEINHFFKSIGTILDADHIRKAYDNSSTKVEIEQALSGGSKDRKVERSNRCET